MYGPEQETPPVKYPFIPCINDLDVTFVLFYQPNGLTGCNITGKVETKKASLKAHPKKLLKDFGRSQTTSLPVVNNTESYLVKVLKKQSDVKKTFRVEIGYLPPLER